MDHDLIQMIFALVSTEAAAASLERDSKRVTTQASQRPESTTYIEKRKERGREMERRNKKKKGREERESEGEREEEGGRGGKEAASNDKV